MSKTKFEVRKRTRDISIDSTDVLDSFTYDSKTRVDFFDHVNNVNTLAGMFFNAENVAYETVQLAFEYMPFTACLHDAFDGAMYNGSAINGFEKIARNLSVYDVLRMLDSDADGMTYTEVSRSVSSYDDKAFARVIGEFWKRPKKGNMRKRGIRVEYAHDEEFTDAVTYDVATDTNGRIAIKGYGITAMYALAKPILENYAVWDAMHQRIQTNRYTRVDITLTKLANGNATQNTDGNKA